MNNDKHFQIKLDATQMDLLKDIQEEVKNPPKTRNFFSGIEIHVKQNGTKIKSITPWVSQFPGKEYDVSIKPYEWRILNLDKDDEVEFIIKVVNLELAKDVIFLASILETLHDYCVELNHPSISLYLPYLPYARADRRFSEGSIIPLQIFTFMLAKINSIVPIKTLYVDDLHSQVARNELTNHDINFEERTQLECFKSHVLYSHVPEYSAIVAPDKGSVEKARTIANYMKLPLIVINKERKDGKISTTLDHFEENDLIFDKSMVDKFDLSNVLVVDDICDGGGTFVSVAKTLREIPTMGALHLHVTHGIFSGDAIKNLNEYYSRIYACNVYSAIKINITSKNF